MLETAIKIATEAFKGKTDKAGEPYIYHLISVSSKLSELGWGESVQAVAILHDLLEDCPEWNAKMLLEFFPSHVVESIECLTHKKGQSYEDYINQVMNNRVSTLVKIADLEHNMDIRRLEYLSDIDLRRLQKYHSAYKRLVEWHSSFI